MKSSTGQRAYHSGVAAENTVARVYETRGCSIAHTRWRGRGGEIDLIVRDGATVVFVEVKTSKSFAQAAERVSARQIQRIRNSAADFLGSEPSGSLTDARFDVALVDHAGMVQVIENAFGHM